MSNPIVTGCGLPVFGTDTCENEVIVYYNSELTESCPGGYSGGPFTCPSGKFHSLISQADADVQASTYLAVVLTSKCILGFPPVVTSESISKAQSSAFTYQILATNAPTSYGATGLPTGVAVNTVTGVISGSVAALGTYSIPISATNAAGTGHGILTLTVTNKFLVINFSAINHNNSGGAIAPNSVFQISLDGGTYFTPSIGVNYNPTSSIKSRLTCDGFISTSPNPIQSLSQATVAVSGGTLNITGTSNTQQQFTLTNTGAGQGHVNTYGFRSELDPNPSPPSGTYNLQTFPSGTALAVAAILLNVSTDGGLGATFSNVILEQDIFFTIA